MKKWNDCELVRFNNKEDSTKRSELVTRAYNKYLFKVSQENIWYDHKADKCFGGQQNYSSSPREYSFLASKDRFVQNPTWGRRFVQRFFCPFLGENYSISSEALYQTHPSLPKYKDKSVLIVGAGPSTQKVDWESVTADYIWSCNHFFLNPKLAKRKVDLFAVGNEVDVRNPALHEYLTEYPESVACFETTNRPGAQMKAFKHTFADQCFWAHTRYRSQIGAVPRLIVLATLFGCNKISFVGMDGLPKPEMEHAFQPGKKPKGSPTFPGAYDRFRRQFVVFWDYVLHVLSPQVEFQNLGEGTESNLTTDISKQEFPLRIFS